MIVDVLLVLVVVVIIAVAVAVAVGVSGATKRPSQPGPSLSGDRVTTAVLIAAAIWSAGLLAAAALMPAYTSASVSTSDPTSLSGEIPDPTDVVVHRSSATLVQVNGIGVLVPMAIPFLAVATVAVVLQRRRVLARPRAGALAWTVTGLLGGCCVVAMLSVGVFLLPVVVPLVIACSRAPGVGMASGRAPESRSA